MGKWTKMGKFEFGVVVLCGIAFIILAVLRCTTDIAILKKPFMIYVLSCWPMWILIIGNMIAATRDKRNYKDGIGTGCNY